MITEEELFKNITKEIMDSYWGSGCGDPECCGERSMDKYQIEGALEKHLAPYLKELRGQ